MVSNTTNSVLLGAKHTARVEGRRAINNTLGKVDSLPKALVAGAITAGLLYLIRQLGK